MTSTREKISTIQAEIFPRFLPRQKYVSEQAYNWSSVLTMDLGFLVSRVINCLMK